MILTEEGIAYYQSELKKRYLKLFKSLNRKSQCESIIEFSVDSESIFLAASDLISFSKVLIDKSEIK